MKCSMLLRSLFFLHSGVSTLGHVISVSQTAGLGKRDINTNLIDFNDVVSLFPPGWTQAQIEAEFNNQINSAAALAHVAATALQQPNVAGTPEYVRWFGTAATAPILQGYQNVVDLFSESNTRTITVLASDAIASTQGGDVLAFVTTAQPQGMTIFGSFWNLPSSGAVLPPAPGTGTGSIWALNSRASTLLHELFHFTFIIPTSTGVSNAPNTQERYTPQDCLDLATNYPNIAAINPQSLMFYALDITYGWTRNQNFVPPPPPNPNPPPPANDSEGPDPAATLTPPAGSLSWWSIVHKGNDL